MKFIAFLAFVATVCAKTTVQISPNTHCDGIGGYPQHSTCGKNPLQSPYSASEKAALIANDDPSSKDIPNVIFYQNEDCASGVYKEVSGAQCYDFAKLGFKPTCLYIVCKKVSCHIAVLLFLLMRLI